MSVPADRFDEIRRRWIARHQHTFTFQKRRAEISGSSNSRPRHRKSGARVDRPTMTLFIRFSRGR